MSSRQCRRAAALCGLVVMGACSRPAQSRGDIATIARPYVIMVSFDAFRHDYLDRYHPPAFMSVAARGVRASALISSFPSKTFPNHYTLATGLYPGHHGITGNAFYDPARQAWYRLADAKTVRDGSWYGGEPIWVTAERRGVRTGIYFWPGSEAAIEGVRPRLLANYDGTVANAARVNGVSAWLRKPGGERPHLVLLYFSEVDDTTHLYGPDAPQTALAVASVDRALQQLLDSIAAMPFADSVNLVLVSDHGMTRVRADKGIPVSDLLAGGGVDTTRMLVSDNGPTLSLWFGTDTSRTGAAHRVLDRSLVHAHAYLRSETPLAWHLRDNPRAGDLLVVADEGFILQRRASDKPSSLGVHGYDPALPDMQGIFIAAGPDVRPLGVVAPFENVDVYPFLAALLRLEHTPPVDGRLATLAGALR